MSATVCPYISVVKKWIRVADIVKWCDYAGDETAMQRLPEDLRRDGIEAPAALALSKLPKLS